MKKQDGREPREDRIIEEAEKVLQDPLPQSRSMSQEPRPAETNDKEYDLKKFTSSDLDVIREIRDRIAPV